MMLKQSRSTRLLKALRYSLLATSLAATFGAEAAVYNVYGTINFVPAGSVVDNPVGQNIIDTLNGKYAAFSLTVDTSVADSNIDPKMFDLRNAVTSTANVAGITFTSNSNSCSNQELDCRVTSELNIGGSTFDRQSITGQFLASTAFSVADRLSLGVYTTGNDLFTTPQLVDPFSGNIGASFAIYYINNNQANRIAFELSNITATPVPEPATSAMFGASLLLLGFHLQQQRKKSRI
jgi:hypothetical protein